jgi:nucleotide-binding universal stress UspA family protein
MESSRAGDRPSITQSPQATAGPRSILVHVDAGAHALARLQAAESLARAIGAQLSALHAVQRLLPGTLPAVDNDDQERHQLALLRFERFAAERDAHIEWLSSSGDHSIERFVRLARLADLLVLGQHDPADADASDVPAGLVPRILTESGTPALLVPRAPERAFRPPATVVVGWADTREAARALKAALPMLAQGDAKVHLATFGGAADEVRRQHGRVAALMALHGIRKVQFHHAEADDVGESLLSLSRMVAADWLVMGCYGHARAMEFLLGGTSFRVLNEAALPVLLAH